MENDIKVTKLEKKQGIFETGGGQEIEWTNYYIYFKIGEFPMEFKAKVEKVLKDYIELATGEK